MEDREFKADVMEVSPEDAVRWAWANGKAGTEPSPLCDPDGTPCARVLRGEGWRLIYPLPGQEGDILLITAPEVECTYGSGR